jgi:RHS repeat-associated protein
LQLDYTYINSNSNIHDNNGNVLTQTITIGPTVLSQSYAYDALNRLQTATESGAWTQTYDCDRYGNRAVRVGSFIPTPVLTPQSGSSTDFSAFNQGNNRIQLSGFGYDASGNLKSDPTTAANAILYDAENHQVSYTKTGTTTYSYDGDGRRVKKVVGSVTTIFVYNAVGQLTAEYTNDTTPPPGGGGTSHMTSDYLGSTRVVTKADGSVKARYDYLPFGEEISSSVGSRSSISGYSAADDTRQKFTQKESDSESGSDYFLARYYSSAQGRFSSVDPINLTEERLLDPQQINLYVYTRNDPLNLLDPTGATIDFDKDRNGNLTKNGKYSQDLYKKYVEFLNKDSKKYASQLQTIAKLEKSDVNYLVNVTTSELSGSHEAEGRTSTDGTNVLVTIRNIGGPQGEKFSIEGRFAHELEHGREFDDGEFSFVRVNGNWQANPRDYDIYDEVNAFNAQLGVSAPVNDTPMLRSLRDVRNTEQNRANILKAVGGYTNRGSRPVNTAYGGAKPGELIRPTETSGHDFFGRNHL